MCVVACLLSGRVSAMVVQPTELRALASSARAIAHARVVDVRAQASDRLSVQTLVTVEVSTYLKGDLGREVTFAVPGGTLGRYRTLISGAPQFVEGEEIIVFLAARVPALPHVVRLGQGVFRVRQDRLTGERLVSRRPLVGHGLEWQPVARGGADDPRMPLVEFTTLVRTAVGAVR